MEQNITSEDIARYEAEIVRFYRLRKMFLGIGWGCIGLGVLLFPIAVVLGVNGSESGAYAMTYLISFAVSGGIVCFILRGALFNRRIKTRKDLIEKAKRYNGDNLQ